MLGLVVVSTAAYFLIPWYVAKRFADKEFPPREIVALLETEEDIKDMSFLDVIVNRLFSDYYNPKNLNRVNLLNTALLGMSEYLAENEVYIHLEPLTETLSAEELQKKFIVEMRRAKRALKSNAEVPLLICRGADALTNSLGSSHTGISYPLSKFRYLERDGKQCLAVECHRLGLTFVQREKGFIYVTCLADEFQRVAEGARLEKYDRILEIDGRTITTIEDISHAISKKDNETVKIVLERKRERLEKDIFVGSRAYTKNLFEAYEIRYGDTSLAYMALSCFYESLSLSVMMNFPRGAEGLLLDLRGNAGGAMDEMNKLLEIFLPPGTYVYTRKNGQRELRVITDIKTKPIELPIVILVDRYSASAAEMFAAIFQEKKRAVIVGEKTSGMVAIGDIYALENWRWYVVMCITIDEFVSEGSIKDGVGLTPGVQALLSDDDISLGVDSQLEKAKEILLQKIREEKEKKK